LTDRAQVSKIPDGQFSIMHPITRSIIQGSGIGPTLWLVMASDLRCISDINLLFKYADDTNLLVPENTDVDLAVEFGNIQQWADCNGMVIDLNKTKEIVMHRPHPRRWSLPKPLDGIGFEQVQLIVRFTYLLTYSLLNY